MHKPSVKALILPAHFFTLVKEGISGPGLSLQGAANVAVTSIAGSATVPLIVMDIEGFAVCQKPGPTCA